MIRMRLLPFLAIRKGVTPAFIKGLSLLLIILSALFQTSCRETKNNPQANPSKKTDINSVIAERKDTNNLKGLLDVYISENNRTGEMLARKELGKRYRESSQFKEAIDQHDKALEIASIEKDTIEIIQLLNQLGTYFRRIGAFDKGAEYHNHALQYCERYTDKVSPQAQKNRVMSLNGIGNAYLTLENMDVAEEAFKQALQGEKALGSDLGQAINYANLGAIMETRGQLDSAMTYYRYSMEHNQKAKSNLGIALCYNHFGEIAEKKGLWDEAIEAYQRSYDIMVNNTDRWHWLESCIALARVHFKRNNLTATEKYLNKGLEAAQKINSYEHLVSLFKLKSSFEEKKGNIVLALSDYKKGITYQDSIFNNKSISSVQNLRANYEKEKNENEIRAIRQAYKSEQRMKKAILYSSISILLTAIITIFMLIYTIRTKSRSQQLMRKMEQTRQNFFTNVTHEFRTPLTVILGIGKQLEEGKDLSFAHLRSSGSMIVRQGNSLLQLINQLLDISKIKYSIGEPNWCTGDIVAYIRMMVESYQELAKQKRIELAFIPSQTSIVMDFVPDYLQKIIRNLLSNALKFTPEYGNIYITASQKNELFRLSVSDTGVGIPQENLPHIFEAFYQAEDNTSNIGTGIGLSLVHQIVEAMGGSISVNSEENKGSIFTIDLPLIHGKSNIKVLNEYDAAIEKYPYKEDMQLTNDKHENSDLPHILIIEDNADVSYYIGSLLKEQYNVYYARNGKEGIEKANELVPDLIITDLMMPEKNGYELCREIRETEVLTHIPIIIITAKSTEEDRIKGIDAGADAYLYKPFNAEELEVLTKKLLDQRKTLRDKYSQAIENGAEQAVHLSKREQDFINKFIDLVHAQMNTGELDAETIASKMCMSRTQLNRKLIAISGQNTTAYILQIRIGKAKRLLQSNIDTPIGDIATLCGFEDVSYFSRVFKQMTQMTPSQYRKKM